MRRNKLIEQTKGKKIEATKVREYLLRKKTNKRN